MNGGSSVDHDIVIQQLLDSATHPQHDGDGQVLEDYHGHQYLFFRAGGGGGD